MPGIFPLFKVIYLGEASVLNPLTVWRDYNFSWKSTLLAGISCVVRRSSDSVSVPIKTPGPEPGRPDNTRRAELNRKPPVKHQQTPALSKHAKVCNGGELWHEIRFPVQQLWRKPAVCLCLPSSLVLFSVITSKFPLQPHILTPFFSFC